MVDRWREEQPVLPGQALFVTTVPPRLAVAGAQVFWTIDEGDSARIIDVDQVCALPRAAADRRATRGGSGSSRRRPGPGWCCSASPLAQISPKVTGEIGGPPSADPARWSAHAGSLSRVRGTVKIARSPQLAPECRNLPCKAPNQRASCAVGEPALQRGSDRRSRSEQRERCAQSLAHPLQRGGW
jgi:hypothetical protein